jgi:tetratricopeptide (TPR) repeat protein
LLRKTLATDLNEENLKGAIEEFTQAINLKNDFAESYFERGKTYIEIGDFENAEKDFQTAVKLNPKLTESYVYLAQIQLAKGNDEEALKYLEKSSHGQKDYKYYFSLGKINFNNKNYEKAVEYLSKAIEQNPYLVDAYDLRAKAFKELGQYIKAIEDFKRAYTLMPEEKSFFVEISQVYFLLALKKFENNNLESSADYIVKGMEINYDIKLDEKFKKILVEAGKSLIDKNPQKAIIFFDFALRLVNDEDFEKSKQEKEEIESLRKKAIKNLPLKERIVKIISDIYS